MAAAAEAPEAMDARDAKEICWSRLLFIYPLSNQVSDVAQLLNVTKLTKPMKTN